MIEVYVNNQLVDLPDTKVKFGIDYQIFKVSDIGTRTGTRSYSIDLPITDRNKTVFEGNDVITNVSRLPYNKIPAMIFVDGIDIKIRFCTLKSCGNGFKCEFYGGNTNAFYSMKDRRLRDLDFSEYNHFWDFETVKNSRTNTAGYIYPLIDFEIGATDSGNRTVDPDRLLPCIFTDTVLEKIFALQPYSFVNEIAGEQWYIDNPRLEQKLNTVKDNKVGRYTARFGIASAASSPTYFPLTFNGATSDFNYFSNATLTKNYNQYIQFADRKVKLKCSGKFFSENAGTGPVTAHLYIRYNTPDGEVLTPEQVFTVPNLGIGTYTEFDFDFPEFVTGVQENYLTWIRLEWYANGVITMEEQQGFESYMDVECLEILEFADQLIYEQNQGTYHNIYSYVTPSQMLPDWSHAEFVRYYCQKFGLIPVFNDLENELRLIRFDKVLANIGKAKDWSSKIDLSIEHEILFSSDDYGQNNLFKYTDQEGESKPAGTDGNIEIADSNLPFENTVLELPYSATNTNVMFDELEVSRIQILNGLEYKNDTNPRVLFLSRKASTDLSPVGGLTYNDGTDSDTVTDNIPLTRFIKKEEEYNLGFGNSLLEKNYATLTGMIRNSKTLRQPLRLTPADINTLDFTVPVFIDKYESYFYVNRIEGYAPGYNTSCIAELVKLNL